MIVKERPIVALQKYLDHYAEPDAQRLATVTDLPIWGHVIGVPAVGEYDLLPGLLESIRDLGRLTPGRILLILLINARASASPAVHENNRLTLKWLREILTEQRDLGEDHHWLGTHDSFDILVLERCHAGVYIPEKQGVGLVRKIVGDVGSRLFAAGRIQSPIMHQTDADARLPHDYLAIEDRFNEQVAAGVHRYRHVPQNTSQEGHPSWLALQMYEIWLRYYGLGLRFAASPYCYPAIGSLTCFQWEAYAKARGFPRREAGEDFYFLNKMRKLGEVIDDPGSPVTLVCRPSDRVPFGTGQGMARIESLEQRQEIYRVYHPAVFQGLALLLRGAIAAIAEDNPQTVLQKYWQHPAYSPKLHQLVAEIAAEIHLPENLLAARRRSRTLSGAILQLHDWFDAFRTLKTIHALRDRGLGELPLLEAVQLAGESKILPGTISPNASVGEVLALMRNFEENGSPFE